MNNQACDDAATRNPRKAYTDYESSTYTVVSKVAYLIGVQKRIFENEYEPPKMEWYTVMMMAGAAAPPEEEMDFVLDRPFLFAITGADGLPLFVGVVNRP